MFAALDILNSNIASNLMLDQIVLSDRREIFIWALVIIAFILTIAAIFNPKIYLRVSQKITLVMTAILGLFLRAMAKKDKKDNDGESTLDETIETAGYAYDWKQDIFYSILNPWQRDMGYCRLYDEAAAPMGMIIDCEPIYFEYDNKRWLIEFWKGQYDMTTGCEIGIYVTDGPDLNIPGIFNGTFYRSVSDKELISMAYIVKKNNKRLFRREDKHWWLTGFKLGEFSEPSELTMYLTLTLKDEIMRDAFVEGLKKAGYVDDEIFIMWNTVGLVFDKPHTPQPLTRTEKTDWLIQKKNQLLCEKYHEITGPYNTFPEKIKALQEQAPDLYESFLHVGKTNGLFETFEKIKEYLT